MTEVRQGDQGTLNSLPDRFTLEASAGFVVGLWAGQMYNPETEAFSLTLAHWLNRMPIDRWPPAVVVEAIRLHARLIGPDGRLAV